MSDYIIPWLGHAIEVASLGLFGWCWLEARARGRGEHVELLTAVLYAWLLEVFDMLIFGTYHYGAVTWWWVGEVPVYIPLLWAVIIHSSMAMSDHLGLVPWARPFLDGLLAVLIDLAIDAIAIRLGLWHWKIPMDKGWFGVPAPNLCAWMWVVACYSAATRLVRWRIAHRAKARWHRILIPVVAYAGLLSAILLMGAGNRLLGLITHDERLWMFAGHVIGFLAVVWYARSVDVPAESEPPVPRSLLWSRWLMHGSFAMLLGLTGLWRGTPALIVVSAAAMFLEWMVQRVIETRGTNTNVSRWKGQTPWHGAR